MTSPVRLVLALHNHQPVGNFDGVFEAAYQDSYRPFLEILGDYPQLKISLHTSGSLMEWLVDHHPEYIDQLKEFVARGQVEILGGPFYEPILACIPRRDRIGQIRAYSRFLEQVFGQTIRALVDEGADLGLDPDAVRPAHAGLEDVFIALGRRAAP